MEKGEKSEKTGRPNKPQAVSVIFGVLGLLVLLALASVLLGVVLFVVPKFGEIFEGFGTPLPKITMIVLSVSNVLRCYWFVTIPAACVLVAGLVVPYVLLPRRRKLLVLIYVITGWLLFACLTIVVIFALFMPLIALMNSMSS